MINHDAHALNFKLIETIDIRGDVIDAIEDKFPFVMNRAIPSTTLARLFYSLSDSQRPSLIYEISSTFRLIFQSQEIETR